MKRIAIVLTMLACTCMLALGLAACGENADYTKNFTGTWEVTAIQEAGATEPNTEMVAMMKAFGVTMAIDMKEDKSCVFDMGEEQMKGTWKAKDASTAGITFEGYSETEAKLADGKLTFEEDGSKLVCTKKQ